ncbi:uncharacterized protein LOC114518361 [Dendronephthya gigantea]|uniref:uncharacterized protein LOC114518361 n=1 Tax=Dendronephthya gigantea TaxID=151771 RepID=UPI001069E482|nr:uncharacterized protein LOC114518361 [Dendronephthya gigantea]
MRVWTLVGVFILLYHPAFGKPLDKKAKARSTELIREKRQLDDDERSGEMQKFMLDLSSKEDMSRLKERFRSGPEQDIENDAEYRRLKRFSIRDSDEDDEERKSVTSGVETMNMRSSRTSRDIGEVADFDERLMPLAKSTLSYPKYPPWITGAKTKRNPESIETRDKSDAYDEYGEEHEHKIKQTSPHKEERKYQKRKAHDNYKELNVKSNDGNEQEQDLHDEDLIKKSSTDSINSNINSHYIVGGSWELIHHFSPSNVNTTLPNNTTKHSEYLADDMDDVMQYERTEKSRRKPRVSLVRPVRSVETDYEVREISQISSPALKDTHEENGRVIMINTRAIKRDGYIGCFVDQHPNRDLTKLFTVNSLTPDSCQSACKERGHVYAGVQYGYLCHCGDAYGKYGEADDRECNSACLGDEGKKCGGFWRNSVYTSDTSDDTKLNDPSGESSDERETRSHIDRVIPIPPSDQEEKPVRQDITVYLRSEIPKTQETSTPAKQINTKSNKRPDLAATSSKRSEITTPTANHQKLNKAGRSGNPSQAKKRTKVDRNVYLHPQTTSREFVPSNVVLRTLSKSPETKKYVGFIKLKQNWDDGLQKKTNPKTLILAGNIESSFTEMFAEDSQFKKAEVLSLREAEIRDNPDTVHKVLVEFALLFTKKGKKKDEELRKIVQDKSRLGEMPVFADSLDVKEYEDEEKNDSKEEATSKRKRQDGVDAFLEEVFRQI